MAPMNISVVINSLFQTSSLDSIKHTCTTPYHPESNGLFECFNRVFKLEIQTFTHEGLSSNNGFKRLLINDRGNPQGADGKLLGEHMFGYAYWKPHQVVQWPDHRPQTFDTPLLLGSPVKLADSPVHSTTSQQPNIHDSAIGWNTAV